MTKVKITELNILFKKKPSSKINVLYYDLIILKTTVKLSHVFKHCNKCTCSTWFAQVSGILALKADGMCSLYCLSRTYLCSLACLLANYLMLASWLASTGSAGNLTYFPKLEHDDA